MFVIQICIKNENVWDTDLYKNENVCDTDLYKNENVWGYRFV